MTRNPLARLLGFIAVVSGGVIGLHEALYREAFGAHGDYHIGGLLSHAGVDMLTLTVILSVALLYREGHR